MVWLVTHFLVGAGCALLVCGWQQIDPWKTFWLAIAFGTWACLPDIHHLFHLLELSNPGIPHSHDWPWYDLFFAHYTLDQPFFQARNTPMFFHAATFIGISGIYYRLRMHDISDATHMLQLTEQARTEVPAADD